MAGLAGHVHFGPARIEGVGLRVVALLEAGGVAGDAHRVGRLVAAGPVQHVARRRLLVRQQVEPLASRACSRRSAAAAAGPLPVSIRYCCSGSCRRCRRSRSPPCAPSGPSVCTMYLSPRLKKRVVTPWCRNCVLSKLPRTVCACRWRPWPWHGATAPRPRRRPGGSPGTGRCRRRWAAGSAAAVAAGGWARRGRRRAAREPQARPPRPARAAAAPAVHRPRRRLAGGAGWPAATGAATAVAGPGFGAPLSSPCRSGFRPVAAGSAPTARRRWRAGCRSTGVADGAVHVDQRVGHLAARLVDHVVDVQPGLRHRGGDLPEHVGHVGVGDRHAVAPTRAPCSPAGS